MNLLLMDIILAIRSVENAHINVWYRNKLDIIQRQWQWKAARWNKTVAIISVGEFPA